MTTPREPNSSSLIQKALSIQPVAEEIVACWKTGIPPLFAETLKNMSKKLGCSFALRVGEPMQRYLTEAAPKPSSVKAKNGNWGFTKGVISVDERLGKIELKDEKWHTKERTEKDVKKNQPTTLHHLSLQEVLTGLKTGEYIMVGQESDIQSTGRIQVKAKKAPAEQDMIFSIDLNEKNQERLKTPSTKNIKNIKALTSPKVPEPKWWNSTKWGEFSKCAEMYYPAQYKESKIESSTFQDIMVYGIKDPTDTTGKKIIPITGDQDLLFISRNPHKTKEMPGAAFQTLNTFEQDNVNTLLKNRIDIAIAKKESISEIDDTSLARLGCITPYESYVIDKTNKEFDKMVSNMQNLFQHGAENRNPGHPSPIDAPMIFITESGLTLTQNEEEHIKFILKKGFLENNIFDVHPEWDMKKWSPVIKKQLELGHPVPKETVKAYTTFNHIPEAVQSIETEAKFRPSHH